MNDDPTDAQTWLVRARSSLRQAELGHGDPLVVLQDLCFNAQQAAEKGLKAVCVHRQIPFEKVHSLAYLVALLEKAGIEVPADVKEARPLTRYAVRARYPGFLKVDEAKYRAAVELAHRVLCWAEKTVGEG